MHSRLEQFLLNDLYLQQKIRELSELQSEIPLRTLKSSVFCSSPTKTQSKEKKFLGRSLEEELGTTHFNTLVKVFVKYSGLKDYHNVHKLEHWQFHRLLEEGKVYGQNFSKVSADLIFYKGRKANFTDFEGFIRVLVRISLLLYPGKEKYLGLGSLIDEKLSTNLNITQDLELHSKYHDEYKEPTIQSLLNSRKQTLLIVFEIFRSKNSAELAHVPTHMKVKKIGNRTLTIERIILKGFLAFLSAFEFIPNLLSSYNATQFFRAVPCQLPFNESLSFEEFTEACFYTSQKIFDHKQHKGLTCLSLWLNYLDSHPKVLIENPNPLRNSSYTLQRNIDYS